MSIAEIIKLTAFPIKEPIMPPNRYSNIVPITQANRPLKKDLILNNIIYYSPFLY